jgi:hypothetical protein
MRVGSHDGGTVLGSRVRIVRMVMVIDRVELAFSLVEGMHVSVGRKEKRGHWESRWAVYKGRIDRLRGARNEHMVNSQEWTLVSALVQLCSSPFVLYGDDRGTSVGYHTSTYTFQYNHLTHG